MLSEPAQPAQRWDDWSHWAGFGRGRPRQVDLEQQCIPSAWQATRTAVMIAAFCLCCRGRLRSETGPTGPALGPLGRFCRYIGLPLSD